MNATKLDAMKISAQFAAYVWYTKRVVSGREAAAAEFARENWPKFLPLAHVGLGRLLRRIAGVASGAGKRRSLKGQSLKEQSLPIKAHAPKLSRLRTLARAMTKQLRQR